MINFFKYILIVFILSSITGCESDAANYDNYIGYWHTTQKSRWDGADADVVLEIKKDGETYLAKDFTLTNNFKFRALTISNNQLTMGV